MPLRLRDGVTLYFCRHGETEANVEKRFQGWTRDTPLTAKGREQVRAIAATLKAEAPNFAALAYVSSPLPRARTTMEIIRETIGLPRDGYTTDERIMEINLGSWDGLTDAEAEARDPGAYAKRMGNKGEVRVPGGGESYADVAARIESWIADIGIDTFAVSHGAATRILRGLFQGLSWGEMSELDEKQGVLFLARGNSVQRIDSN
ncbi:MAG TPA: histidine phosphatase family protein [Rhizomicrobium sp.]|jgi:probable phosphoglycerate mutase